MENPTMPTVEVNPVELDDASYLSAYCPNPKMPLWSTHPRVYLTFDANGRTKCPYCSTVYQLKPGVPTHRH
ncbi:MAG TPA: zinc-finger domain-containing protein [Burkholderiaceae bacterium]|nr:zinc-finger domain-containing protein [Burkholderiaceae bacterium]